MHPDQKMYTRTQLVMYCFLALVVSAGVAYGVRVSPLWEPLTKPFRSPSRPLWELASLSNPTNTKNLPKKLEAILARLDEKLTPEQQEKLLHDYQSLKIWKDLKWQGVPVPGANPCDLWVIQQIIHDVRPEFILETGTGFGGCALYYADLLEDLGLENTRVITIGEKADIQQAAQHRAWKEHVDYVQDEPTYPEMVERLAERIKGKKVVVVLGSSHDEQQVLEELRLYAPLVSPGSYLVVRDTYVDGNSLGRRQERGPMSAVLTFLKTKQGSEFSQDRLRETMVLTFNRGGWLKKKAK